MPEPIATGQLRHRILWGAAIYGIFFGLLPPYVVMITVVATWDMPPLEQPGEQSFRAVYYIRLALGNLVGLSVGGLLSAGAVALGLRVVPKPTYLYGLLGGLILGPIVGALTAGSTPLFLLLSSSNVEWAWKLIGRSFICGALMGLTNGVAAALAIVYFLKRAAT